ncbi:MAG: phage holin family protein [Thermoanaerobaculia bacterium]
MSDEIVTPEDLPPGWSERLESIRKAAGALIVTRAAIFREEVSEKTSHLTHGLAAISIALAFGSVALLVFTGFLAAVFARLFGGAVWGLLAVFVLYGLITGGAALLGMKSLRRVRPGDFPVTRGELRKDWAALELARSAPEEPEERDEDELPRDDRFGPDAVRPGRDGRDEDFEARYRAEAE